MAEGGMTLKTFENTRDFSCALHVLRDARGNLLVDPGYCDARILEYLHSIGGIQAILLTHGHFDHIRGLDAVHGSYPEAAIHIHPLDLPMLRDAALNGSAWMDVGMTAGAPAQALSAGEHQVAGHRLRVLHTPGHTPGSCMFSLPDVGVLFTGDTIIGDSVGRTDLPGGDAEALRASLRAFLREPFPADTRVCFGHGDEMCYDVMLSRNPFCAGAEAAWKT